ncbi:unnamed protein product [Cyclocybe aegerita]|uniref:Uncharacterized protein n=1 Tax=Cyclocybe aegerita TaxID=1973307 RepID=A0A8S0VT39_CYCAE|nr:unnamed protein product [Cyclocybe aegerita]
MGTRQGWRHDDEDRNTMRMAGAQRRRWQGMTRTARAPFTSALSLVHASHPLPRPLALSPSDTPPSRPSAALTLCPILCPCARTLPCPFALCPTPRLLPCPSPVTLHLCPLPPPLNLCLHPSTFVPPVACCPLPFLPILCLRPRPSPFTVALHPHPSPPAQHLQLAAQGEGEHKEGGAQAPKESPQAPKEGERAEALPTALSPGTHSNGLSVGGLFNHSPDIGHGCGAIVSYSTPYASANSISTHCQTFLGKTHLGWETASDMNPSAPTTPELQVQCPNPNFNFHKLFLASLDRADAPATENDDDVFGTSSLTTPEPTPPSSTII